MKKGLIFLALIFIFMKAMQAQTIFSYGNHSVDQSEFLRVYQKNRSLNSNQNQSLKEYLDLYSIFKMKVQEGREQGLDTALNFRNEIENFKIQILHNYLTDEATMNQLIQQAFTRMQQDIHVDDYFITTNDLDDVKSATLANNIYNVLNQPGGVKDIHQWENENVKIEVNDLGFVTAFSLPYNFENALYEMGKQNFSKPIKTKSGYHILRRVSSRPGLGRIKVAQILIAFPPNDAEQKLKAKHVADSVYQLLKSGSDFSQLVKKLSNDHSSMLDDGKIPEFGVGEYNPAFEQGAFSLQKNGDISEPIETELGYHIIKRISRTNIPSSLDENFKYILQEKINSDERHEIVNQAFLKTVLNKTQMKPVSVTISDLWNVIDSSLMENSKVKSGMVDESTQLVKFGDNTDADVGEFILFLRNSDQVVPGKLHESYEQLLPEFYNHAAIENYKKNLALFNPDFKTQLEEFEEANLLFEMMQKKVWLKASMDSAGQQKYYQEHRNKYMWKESADVVIFNCKNLSAANRAIQSLKDGKNWMELWNERIDEIQADSGRFELSQLKEYTHDHLYAGFISQPLKNLQEDFATFVKIIRLYPPNQQRTFDEARGLVINDYQNSIEQQWITELKKKYPIKINTKAFGKLLKKYN